MATIVYEGVGGGGSLFRGNRFFLLQRIPSRNQWRDAILANGGEVVPLEERADIVIADHARKDQPVGSISWTFIEASLKKGELVNPEEHSAGPATATIRPVGSSQPAKTGRTKFTAEDDRILMNWCAKAERQGQSLRGNIIFQQLEAVNNRHTYQSWRDRWVKYVSEQPRPQELQDNDDHEAEEEEDGPSPVRQALPRPAVPRPTPQPAPSRAPPPARVAARRAPIEPAPSQKVKSSPISRSSNTTPVIRRSKGGSVFSDVETQLLLENYDEIMNIGDDQVIDAWIAWSSVHSNHTAQEWRNYFNEYVVPKVIADEKRKKAKPPVKATYTVQTIPGPSGSKHGKQQALEVKDSQGSSGEAFHSPKQDTTTVDDTIADEATFKRNILHLAEQLGLDVNFNPIICGRPIPLFRLWQIVESDELGGYHEVNERNLWYKVAKKLNFNEFKHKNADAEIRDCFREILADYEDIEKNTEEIEEDVSMTESQERAMINDQLRQTAARETQNLANPEAIEDDDEDDDLDRPQSTPRQILRPSKRRFDNSGQDFLLNKRLRSDKGKGKEPKIPSTPEDVINGEHIPGSSFNSSDVHYPELNHHEDNESLDGLFVQPTKQRPAASSFQRPSLPSRILEPETQDFHFIPNPEESFHGALDDLTPSPRRSSPELPDRHRSSIAATHGTPGSSNRNDESSTQSQTDEQRNAEIETFIDQHISMGNTQDNVLAALESTCNEFTHAAFVMESLYSGEGIPENLPGVWTWSDDQAIYKRKESSEFEKVVRKHGIKGVIKRKKFLRKQKKADEFVASGNS
ncbi:uncharacterized protein LY89DRAFT_652986 [Mollisia scopiformis]|uniref:DNA-binding protein RAP1 n=1 Tax=Mollisia scopiformis TaxID=149040 RepID=A0A194WX04_MOLSC|nr:uncharacterized protein LY89DRAFT_652986 [Mollisia scopiformis]KUJ12511.1 hypothetical protein LY89DRAFT_652986 [Mollisia scopiformis]